MTEQVTVGVYRRLDNRLKGDFDDTSELAWELHRRRAQALGEVFGEANVVVLDSVADLDAL